MSREQAYTIEIHGRAAGIVVAGPGGFTFFASDHAVRRLNRTVFRKVADVQRAARRLMSTQTRSPV